MELTRFAGMGAGQGALAYDSSKLFAPFVCYFDTSENASLNRLPESTKSKKLQAKADAAFVFLAPPRRR